MVDAAGWESGRQPFMVKISAKESDKYLMTEPGDASKSSLPTGAIDITGRVLDQLTIRQAERSMQIDPRPGFTLKLEDAYASAINISVYSDYFENRPVLESIRLGDVIRVVGWTLRLRNPQGQIWEGGAGHDHNPRRAVVVSVLKLQVNDQKKFGNWDEETNQFPPQ